jgi:hypothetical protein
MMMMTMPHDQRRRQPQSSALRQAAAAAAAAAADAQSDRRGAVRNGGFGCVASEISMQTVGAAHATRLSASNTVKKAALLTLSAQTRRLLRILGGDVSQKDQSKCHS